MSRRQGRVVAICIGRAAGARMECVNSVMAIAGAGLEGDRYCVGQGSFNAKKGVGHRQVTLINGLFFKDTPFAYADSRRNIVTMDVELMELIGQEFDIGEVRLCGLKYCDPCLRPSQISGVDTSFRETFWDRGGIVATILRGGLIQVDSPVIPPSRDYE